MTGSGPGSVAPRPLHRPLADIAGAIVDDCERHGGRVPAAAEPFVRTMLGLATTDLTARYGHGAVADVVRAALENLDGWRTETAWHIKHELRQALAAVDRR